MMKQVNTLYTVMTVSVLLGGAILWNGCETESVSDQKVTISPPSARLAINQALELVASGGFMYTWSLEDPTIGTLSTRTGPRTVYTARVNPGTNAAATAISIQTVTVTSTVSSGGSTNSVTSGLQASAIATIEHVPVPSSPSSPNAVVLSATPSSAAIDVTTDIGKSTSFTASGGTGSYVWSISSEAFGFISNKRGPQTTYTYTETTAATGTIIITATSGSETFRIFVTHF